MVEPEMLERAFTADSLNAPDAGRDAAFTHDLDQADFAKRARVRAAAKFGRKFTDLHHADALPVFFSEQRYGFVFIDGDVDWDILYRIDRRIAQDVLVRSEERRV